MHEYSEQQVFDYVVEHLYKQGKPSMSNGKCAYRGENGLKCAAGILISDDVYQEQWDWCKISYSDLCRIGDVQSAHEGLVIWLQNAHDYWATIGWGAMDHLDRELTQVANRFHLEFDSSKYGKS